MSLISMISSMSSMVSQIGPGFKAAGSMAIKAFKGVIRWFNDKLIKPITDKLDAISWDSIKTKAEETWEGIKALVDEKLGALWDLLPDMPEALTWDYWFGEGGVFDWDLDWESWFDFDLPKELTYDHYFGEGGVFDWDLDWKSWFDFELPDELTYDHYFGEGGVFNWDIDWGSIFSFTLPDWMTLDYYFGEGGVFDWDISWSDLFSFTLPDWLTLDYYFGEGGIFDWDINWASIFSFTLPDWLTLDYYFGEGGIFDWDFSGVVTTMSSAFSDVGTTIGGYLKAPINLLIESINNLFASINFTKTIPNPFGDDFTVGLDLSSWSIPALAKGGIINKPTLAVVGEDGPEAVIPLSQRNNPGGVGMGGGTFNITVNAGGITDRTDKRTLAREIGNMIQQEMARNIGGTTMRGRY